MITLWSRDVCDTMFDLLDRIILDNARAPVDVYFHSGAIVAFCLDKKGDRVKYSAARIEKDDDSTKIVVICEPAHLKAPGGQDRQEVAKNTELWEGYLRDTNTRKPRWHKPTHRFRLPEFHNGRYYF